MSLALLAIAFLALLMVAYRLYGGWVARQVCLDDRRVTPAHKRNDGVDYVPTRMVYLFPQHFSAIAAAGPIAGPILACQSFGWLPCLLWIGLGVVLIGAVHDFSSLAASVRHGGTSIADITRNLMGPRAGIAIMIFIWITLIYVTVAFTAMTSASFVTAPDELQGVAVDFNPGGAVASASIMYLLLSMVMGLVQRFLKPPLWLLTMIFVPATLGVVWLGTSLSTLLTFDLQTWGLLILAYCAVASVVPVWALLQPRGYLGGFILFLALGLGVIGIFFGGYEIKQSAFRSFDIGGATGTLFPFLFVTIACGACSGFHGLVCSGTTCKQIDKESHIKPVGYGAMLAEGFVAFISLVTIMIVASGDITGLSPATIYGNGIGKFLTLIIGEENLPFAITFGAMAFSTFVFDTLDVCTRLGRYIIQEIFHWPGKLGAISATLITVAVPVYFVASSLDAGWRGFWTLFGASNQLLAALTLLAISIWLYKARRRIAFTLLPMLFVLTITLWALGKLTWNNFSSEQITSVMIINGIASLSLILLAVYLVVKGILEAKRGKRDESGFLEPEMTRSAN
ncbi:MAG: carbon starvation protein A [bacterium]|nr:carbon starvation protein A [bacterium]